MDLNAVITILQGEDLEFNVFFTKKTKQLYSSFSPNVSIAVTNELLQFCIRYLVDFIDIEEVDYNPTGYRDGTKELCNVNYVGNYDEVMRSFEPGNIENIEDEVEDFTFYCIEVTNNTTGENVKLFRRVTKFKKLSSKGILAAFQGNTLNKIDSKMIGLDGEVDLISYNGQILILNHVSLERIFRVNEQFAAKAAEALNDIGSTDKILNFESFEEDCLNDGRYQRILTRMLHEGNTLTTCLDNFNNIVETIEIFELSINVDKENHRIIYSDKSQVMDILRIVRDSYYRSIIRQLPGIDNKI